jgi:hypothetical protein
LSLAAAAGVSVVTLRKHLQAGRLPGVKSKDGAHGETWQIDPAELAAFIGGRYGRPIDLSGLTDEPTRPPAPTTALDAARAQAEHDAALAARADEAERQRGVAEAAAGELRTRLEDILQRLGEYRALVEASEHTDRRIETILGERIAELQHEPDAAQAELERLRSRGLFARLFGG